MLKIVCIDDEYFFRKSLINGLPWEEYGFKIVGDANNGRSGMELILNERPDIAIIDINMPLLTGLELIEQLTSQNVHCKYILLTGYDDFKYAQKAIHLNVSEYILKPVDFSLLLDSLNNLKQEIQKERVNSQHIQTLENHRNHKTKENFLLDLVHGCFSFNESHLLDYLDELGICLPFNDYTIYLLKFSKLSSQELEHMQVLLEESLKQTSTSEIFITGHSQICLITETPSEADSQSITRHVLRYLTPQNTIFHLGVSALHHGVAEIIPAYNEAMLCTKNAISQNRSVQYIHEINTSFFHIPNEQLLTLKKLLRLKDSNGIRIFISQLYNNWKKQSLSYNNIVFCTYELLSCLISALNEQHDIHYFSNSNTTNFFDVTTHFHTLNELEEWIIDFFLNQIQIDSITNTLSVSKKIEHYIKDHYTEADLNIELISKHLFLNYSYICYCFKKDKGITINDFLNQIRLEKALQLFHSGCDNVGYVAEQTGFHDSGYFSKKFKKAFGLSPSEYIKTI